MIRLKNVSKFYYSKGVIASGFTKVNLKLDMGEFVAITGESGSGKSTLLNVISGLDSYEEGEMYINGEETSHYTEKDFENYRRTYIGNIFQSFNLINSYSVYQNIELILLLNGEKKKDIKDKVNELIQKVGLEKFKNTKVSKLSGGQKQRVAIARALAKDTPVIIADEPTGNLDEKSAKEVIQLLSQIAKDKLVIVVTHNYEQVESYVTRKIKMHDGKIVEDKVIRPIKKKKNPQIHTYKNITFANKIRLGVRNAFNIVPKFLLVFAVYFFITSALLSEYASFKKEEHLSSLEGYNWVFSDLSTNRIIIKKENGKPFVEADYQKIEEIEAVKSISKNDLLVDGEIYLNSDLSYVYGTAMELKTFDGELDLGRMPTNDDEIIVEGSTDYYFMSEELLNSELNREDLNTGQLKEDYKLKVVGMKYTEEETSSYSSSTKIYVSDKVMRDIEKEINERYSTIKTLYQNQYTSYLVAPNENVPAGKAYVSQEFGDLAENVNPIDKTIEIEVENRYYDEKLTVTIDKIYTKNNLETLLKLKDYEENSGTIFIATQDYDHLFNKNVYQSSVFVEDSREVEEVTKKLQDMGIQTLAIKDTLVSSGTSEILRIFKTIVTIVVVVALLFVSYFIIKIILKSRNVYFSTIRMLGSTKKICKNLLVIELFVVSNLAFFAFIGLILLVQNNIIRIDYLNNLITYLNIRDYIFLYVILILMSYITSLKFAKSIFKKTAMNAYKEEV